MTRITYFPQFWRTRKYKIKLQAEPVSGEVFLAHSVLTWNEGQGTLWEPFHKDTNAMHEYSLMT